MTDSGAAVAVPEIREITTVEQTFAAAEVLRKVWGEEHPGMPANLLRALAQDVSA